MFRPKERHRLLTTRSDDNSTLYFHHEITGEIIAELLARTDNFRAIALNYDQLPLGFNKTFINLRKAMKYIETEFHKSHYSFLPPIDLEIFPLKEK